MDNVIVTPHSLCWTDECFHNMASTGLASIVDALAGRRPRVRRQSGRARASAGARLAAGLGTGSPSARTNLSASRNAAQSSRQIHGSPGAEKRHPDERRKNPTSDMALARPGEGIL